MRDLSTTKPTGQLATFMERMERVKNHPRRGRLVFVVDATGSREPTWVLASRLQADMFEAVAALGTLQMQLVFFRGNAGYDGECKVSSWISDGRTLARLMGKVFCRTGHTQIQKVLRHIQDEQQRQPISAVVYIGDMCEEQPEALYDAASGLGAPMFVFGEGDDTHATPIFKELARITGGAYAPFDSGSAAQLRELLRAVAVFAAGGLAALQGQRGEAAVRLLSQIRK
jgi:hypothetical protein